jgi:formylglycine-generating enzyme required for sulfatase activity
VPGGEVKLEDVAEPLTVRPFRIAIYPVTYAQYRAFSDTVYAHPAWWDDAKPNHQAPGKQSMTLDNYPAENVSWYDAMAFCRWLSQKLGYAVRLPTEWEWQHAACGGNPENMYPWGKKWNSACANTETGGVGHTVAVGLFPNGITPLGVYDMVGNVWEWCLNRSEDPNIIAPERSVKRALRGAAWSSIRTKAHVTYRASDKPNRRSPFIGFRLAMDND